MTYLKMTLIAMMIFSKVSSASETTPPTENLLLVDPGSIEITMTTAQPPVLEVLNLQNLSSQGLFVTVSENVQWMLMEPVSQVIAPEKRISVPLHFSLAYLEVGTYTGLILIEGDYLFDPVSVTLHVVDPKPQIEASVDEIRVFAQRFGNPTDVSFDVSVSGGHIPMTFKVETSQSHPIGLNGPYTPVTWMSVTPTSAVTTPHEGTRVTLSFNTSRLNPGEHIGYVVVTGANGSRDIVSVLLTKAGQSVEN